MRWGLSMQATGDKGAELGIDAMVVALVEYRKGIKPDHISRLFQGQDSQIHR